MENTTVAWGAAALLALAIGGPFEQARNASAANVINTDAMLDVSVSIRTISHVSIDRFGDSVWAPGSGSGLLVSSDTCEVWTNHHVIEDAAVIEILPRGWDAVHGIPARVINSSPRTDVAILKMASCKGIPQAQLGDSGEARPGDEAYAVGNPLGSNPDSISRGIISHVERYLAGPTPYLQTDAIINPGNSGGALFDKQGTVIGLNTAIATSHNGNATGIGYAVPINVVRETVAKLRQGPPSWGDAGINNLMAGLTTDEAEIFQVPAGFGAVNITETPQDGAAKGKLFARDVVFKIGTTGVTSPSQVKRVIGGYNAGDVVPFHLVRGGKVISVDLTLEEGWQANTAPKPDTYSGLLGMSLEMWGEKQDDLGQFKTPVITLIHSLGPAHRGYIVSSQSAVGRNGPYVMPYQLTVSTVTGVVIDGVYQPVKDIATLDALALEAYRSATPLLLEIETWQRDPRYIESPLQQTTTAFYRVMPAPSVQVMTDHPGRLTAWGNAATESGQALQSSETSG